MGFFDNDDKVCNGDRVVYGSVYFGGGEKLGTAISNEDSSGHVDIKLDDGKVLWSVPPASFRKG